MHPESTNSPLVNVAIGILHREDGQVLMAKRPDDKPSGGRWEFPGGKIEAGESPHQALLRELREEVGIEIMVAEHWITRQQAYDTLTARLHIFRVSQWLGEPAGCEGQQLSWQLPGAMTVEPLLTVNHGILEAFQSTDWTQSRQVQDSL